MVDRARYEQEQGRAACRHLPTPQQADVGPPKNASPLGSRVGQVEIRTSEHSGNNRFQEAPDFGVASGITRLAQRGVYRFLVTKQQKQGYETTDEERNESVKDYAAEKMLGGGVSNTKKTQRIFSRVQDTLLGKVQTCYFKRCKSHPSHHCCISSLQIFSLWANIPSSLFCCVEHSGVTVSLHTQPSYLQSGIFFSAFRSSLWAGKKLQKRNIRLQTFRHGSFMAMFQQKKLSARHSPGSLPGKGLDITLPFYLAPTGYGKQLLTVLLHHTGRAEKDHDDFSLDPLQ